MDVKEHYQPSAHMEKIRRKKKSQTLENMQTSANKSTVSTSSH
jgi:hypothetical protein